MTQLNEKEVDILKESVIYGSIKSIIFDSLQYKWDSFKEEKEWRMFFVNMSKDDKYLFASEEDLDLWHRKYDKILKVLRGNIDFYPRKNGIVPFFPVSFCDLSDYPIKRLYVGPKNDSYDKDIKLLFTREKIKSPKISYSKISYR